MSVRPITEAINTSKKDIEGLSGILAKLHNLAVVFTKRKDDSPVYRTNYSVDTLRFPPSLASVIYAAFHKDDDRGYFGLVAEAVTGDISRESRRDVAKEAGLRYDPATARIIPVAAKYDSTNEKIGQAEDARRTPDYNRTFMKEARKYIAHILNNPEDLKDAGTKFGTYLFDLLSHMEDGQNSIPLVDDLGHIMKVYGAEYRTELYSDKPLSVESYDEEGNPRKSYLAPKAKQVTMAEIYTYIACRMSEKYGSGIMEQYRDATSSDDDGKTSFDLQDTAGYIRDWVEGEGLPDEREYQTGEGRSEYIALDLKNPELDLTGAPVAPKSLKQLFAKDCDAFRFKREKDTINDPQIVDFGYTLMAKVLAIKPEFRDKKEGESDNEYREYRMDVMHDAINAFIGGLVHDVNRAIEVRNGALAMLKEIRGKQGDNAPEMGAIDNIIRNVFQDTGTDEVTPGVSGTGMEILLRKTSVAAGEITTRVLRAVKRFPGKYKVIDDNKRTGNITIEIAGDKVDINRNDLAAADEYVCPTLFPFMDTTSSFTTYAVWRGIAPYSRVVDNKLEYLNDEDPELHEARRTEGEQIVGNALGSVVERNPAVALSGTKEFTEVPKMDKGELVQMLPKEHGGTSKENMNAAIADRLDEGTLHAYAIMANVAEYDYQLNTLMGMSVTQEGAPVRYALRDVLGNMATLASNSSPEDIVEKITERAIEYASVISANGLDVAVSNPIYKTDEDGNVVYETDANGNVKIDPRTGNPSPVVDVKKSELNEEWLKSTKMLGKEYGVELLDSLAGKNVPGSIVSAYGDDRQAALVAFRSFLNDLTDAANKFVTGYGYHGLDVSNVYTGGKYTDGNRVLVNLDTQNMTPITRFADPNGVIESSRATELSLIKTASYILSYSTIGGGQNSLMQMFKRNWQLAQESGKLLERVPVKPEIKDSLVKEATGAFADLGRKYAHLGMVYANIYALLASLIIDGPVTTNVKRSLMRGVDVKDIKSRVKEAVYGKQTFKKVMNCFEKVRTLTGNGKLLEDISDAFRGTSVGDQSEHMAYAELASSAIKAMDDIRDINSLKTEVAKFFHTNPRKLSEMGESDTVSLGDVDEAETATGFKERGIDELVGDSLPNWKSDNSGVYNGLTGCLGFDTVRVGNADSDTIAMKPLSSSEYAFTGLDRDAMETCAHLVQSARDDRKEQGERIGDTLTDTMAISERMSWVDELIDFIGKNYMESRLKLNFRQTEAGIMTDSESATEWSNLVDSIVSGIRSRCSKIKIAETAPSRYELTKFLDVVIGNVVTGVGAAGLPLKTISMVSTAFAHAIIRLGDMTFSEAVPGPFAGKTTPVSKIPESMQRVAAERSREGNMNSDENAGDLLNAARDSAVSDETLASELDTLYHDFGMGATEGAKRKLDYFASQLHANYNKLHRAESDINVGIAPNDFAGQMYGVILNSEREGDNTYSMVKRVCKRFADNYPDETLGDFAEKLGLNGQIHNGPYAGKTYIELAFGSNLVNEMLGMKLERVIGSQKRIDALVRAIRYQMTDMLMDNRSFGPIRKNNPELVDRVADTFFKLAGNLQGGSAATIFAALDPAERNAAHDAHTRNLRDAMNMDATIGAKFDTDEDIKSLTGQYPDSRINETELNKILEEIIFPDGDSKEEKDAAVKDGYDKLDLLVGGDAVNLVKNALASDYAKEYISRNSTVNGKSIFKEAIANSIISLFGSTPRELYAAAEKLQDAEADIYGKLRSSLYDIYVNRKSSTPESERKAERATDFVKSAMNPFGERYIENVMELLDSDRSGEPQKVIWGVLRKTRLSRDPEAKAIAKFAEQSVQAKNMPTRGVGKKVREVAQGLGLPTAGSINTLNSQNRHVREVGGSFGTPFITQKNEEAMSGNMRTVAKELAKFNVASSDAMKVAFGSKLKQETGFKGSIKDFCQEVNDKFEEYATQTGKNIGDTDTRKLLSDAVRREIQTAIAIDYAGDRKNYDTAALNKQFSGAIGALAKEAGKIPRHGELDETAIRTIAVAGIPQIEMMYDDEGNDVGKIRIGRDEPVSIDSPIARQQMNVIVNRAEDMIHKSVFNADGDVTPEGKMAIANVVKENTSPVDPKITTNSIVDIVIRIIQRSMDGDTGKPWMAGPVNGKYIRMYTDPNGNEFRAEFTRDRIERIVSGIIGGKYSDSTVDDIRREIKQYLIQTKGTVVGELPMTERKIKNDILAKIKNWAKAMVASGGHNVRLSKDGMEVTWLNPPTKSPTDDRDSVVARGRQKMVQKGKIRPRVAPSAHKAPAQAPAPENVAPPMKPDKSSGPARKSPDGSTEQ